MSNLSLTHLLFVTLFLISLTACGATPSVPPTTAAPTTIPAGATRVDTAGIEQVWACGVIYDGDISEEAAKLTPPKWGKSALVSEQPQHKVTLTQGFWLDKYEVTQAAYQSFVAAKGYQEERYWSAAGWKWLNGKSYIAKCQATAPHEPQVCITWYEAEAYAHWRDGELPTEAQWEYAARGPDSHIYPWGNVFDPTKTNLVNSEGLTVVGNYPTGVSWVGAHDMSGNAMEWVQDWLDVKYYGQNIEIDPPGPVKGSRKVEKGGWWGSDPFVARAAYRHFEDPPTYQDHHIGLRVVSIK